MCYRPNLLDFSSTLQNSGSKLKVVVMSASINQQQFSEYFFGCPVIECEGRMHAVELIYKPVPTEKIEFEYQTGSFSENYDSDSESFDESNDEENETPSKSKLVLHAVHVLFNDIIPREKGDVLIFLPGKREIHGALELIKNLSGNRGNLTCTNYVRKVVCCTNIAETSLTIPGVKYVIDAGLARKVAYDHELRVTALELQSNSQASAKQRQGRAGRIEPGFCYRVCSEEEFEKLKKYDEPELKQCPIDELYLYALKWFGSIENLVLMPDAQPDESSVRFAEERLLNLKFIIRSPMRDISLPDEGKLAINLMGQISLEGVRMILESRKLGLLVQAIQFAVLVKQGSDLQVKKVTRYEVEGRSLYLDELGDAFTWFRIYKTYLEIEQRKGRSETHTDQREWKVIQNLGAKNWCQNIGVNYEILRSIHKSIDSVYRTLKQQKIVSQEFHEQFVPLDQILEPLHNLLVTGYFHNIAEMHEKPFIESGYSMLTPSNVTRDFCETERGSSEQNHTHLLKIYLSNKSALSKLGDVVENTYVIFTELFKTSGGKVFMQAACRIQSEKIIDHASDRWLKQNNIVQRKMPFSLSELKSFVTKLPIQFVGPKILGEVLKELKHMKLDDDSSYLQSLEKRSGAVIRFMFDSGQIGIYGSECEAKNANEKSDLKKLVEDKKLQFIRNDYQVPYPHSKKRRTLGLFESGLRLNDTAISVPQAEVVTNYSKIKPTVIMFRNIAPDEKPNLEATLEDIRENCHNDEVLELWGEPQIFDNDFFTDRTGCPCLKIKFTSAIVAEYIDSNFKSTAEQNGLSEAHCFLDNNVEIFVPDTYIYPSVHEIAEDFPDVKITARKRLFVLSSLNWKAKNSVIDFKNTLNEQEIFLSEVVKETDIGLPKSAWKHTFKRLQEIKEKVESESECENYLIQLHGSIKPFFEVFGDDKYEISCDIQTELDLVRGKVKNHEDNLLFFLSYKLQRGELKRLRTKLSELRGQFLSDCVTFTVTLGSRNDDKILPTVRVLAPSRELGLKAFYELKRNIETTQATSTMEAKNGDTKCCKCLQKIHLDKPLKHIKKKKGADVVDLNPEVHDMGFSLTICGCIYCSSCLYNLACDQIEAGIFHKSGIKCDAISDQTRKMCDQIIINQDLKDRLSFNLWSDLLDAAWLSYLTFWASSKPVVIDSCPACMEFFTYPRGIVGVIRCPNSYCKDYHCSRCGSTVYDEDTFYYHTNENCSCAD